MALSESSTALMALVSAAVSFCFWLQESSVVTANRIAINDLEWVVMGFVSFLSKDG